LQLYGQAGKRAVHVVAAVALACLSLLCEGGIYLLPVLACFHFFHNRHGIACLGVTIWCAILFANAYLGWSYGATGISLFNTLCFDSEWMMVAVVPLALLYNGARGLNTTAAKNLFYWFYPIHLWILMAVARMM
jgi:hypothetical protein